MNPAHLRRLRIAASLFLMAGMFLPSAAHAAEPANYSELTKLFSEWREFTQPTMKDGVQDHGAAAMTAKAAALPQWRKRLDAIGPQGLAR